VVSSSIWRVVCAVLWVDAIWADAVFEAVGVAFSAEVAFESWIVDVLDCSCFMRSKKISSWSV